MAPKTMGSPGYRLRAVLVPIYIPTFILCICSAAIVNDALPALGLIPTTVSFVHSAALVWPAWKRRNDHFHEDDDDDEDEHVRRWPVKKRGSVNLNNPGFTLLVDLFVSFTLLIILICTWTVAPWERSYFDKSQGMVVLATYTTVPMIFGFIAHTWLAILDVGEIFRALRRGKRPAECPNCHARFHSSSGPIEASQGDRPEDYTINRPSEETTFRDTSFDSDVAIAPDQNETLTVAGKSS